MALTIPSFPDDRDPDHPIRDAYAWISYLAIDLASGSGRFVLSVHPRESAWTARPVGQVGVALGQEFGPAAKFPALADLMADPEFAAAFNTIGSKLYAAGVAAVPALAGATPS